MKVYQVQNSTEDDVSIAITVLCACQLRLAYCSLPLSFIAVVFFLFYEDKYRWSSVGSFLQEVWVSPEDSNVAPYIAPVWLLLKLFFFLCFSSKKVPKVVLVIIMLLYGPILYPFYYNYYHYSGLGSAELGLRLLACCQRMHQTMLKARGQPEVRD